MLGCIWTLDDGAQSHPIGCVVICDGYAIEFGGRDAFIHEFYLEPCARGKGFDAAAPGQVVAATRAENIRALHPEVAHDNTSAQRVCGRASFAKREHSRLMTLLLTDERSQGHMH